MKRTLFAAIFLAHLTAACASTPEPQVRIETRDVLVPVARSCVPAALPAPPTFNVTVGAIVGAPDAAERYRLAIVGLLERDARLTLVEPVINTCRD